MSRGQQKLHTANFGLSNGIRVVSCLFMCLVCGRCGFDCGIASFCRPTRHISAHIGARAHRRAHIAPMITLRTTGASCNVRTAGRVPAAPRPLSGRWHGLHNSSSRCVHLCVCVPRLTASACTPCAPTHSQRTTGPATPSLLSQDH